MYDEFADLLCSVMLMMMMMMMMMMMLWCYGSSRVLSGQ
jgi:hypothetical protein